jgi:chemotaxis protein methyltransferase CheR
MRSQHVLAEDAQPKLGEPSGGLIDFKMTDEDLRRVAARAIAMLGIEFGDAKRQMIYSRLSRRLRATSKRSFAEYLDYLDTPVGAAEAEHFANALTTNLTSFFREAHHFEHLEGEICKPRPAARRLRIWSAGCSTGEEPYSIAMILHANADHLGCLDRRVLATDIDSDVLATASRASYSFDKIKTLPSRFRTSEFFNAEGARSTVTDSVRNLVILRALNLVSSWPFRGPFDMIFCRNVLIYFPVEVRRRVVDRFTDLLQPGGYLYLGHSESTLGVHPKLAPEGHTIYRKVRA